MPIISQLFYNKTATVERFTETRNTIGEVVKTWVVHLSDLSCAFQERNGGEPVQDDQKKTFKQYRCYFQDIYDIKPTDRLVIDTTNYEILYVADKESDHLEIDLKLEI